MRKSVKVGLVGFFVGCLAIVGGVTVVWQAYGLGFVERRIAEALAEQGVPVGALTLRSVGTDQAVLTDLQIEMAGGIAVRQVRAEYGLAELLWDRRVDRLILSGLRIDVAAPEAGSAMLVQTTVPQWPPAGLPVGNIVVEDGEIAFPTPVGRLGLTVDLEAQTLADGEVAISGRTRIRGEAGELGTPFAGSILPDGAFSLTAIPESGSLGWGDALLESPEGTITIAGTAAALTLIDVALGADIRLPDGSVARLDVLGGLVGDSGTLDLGLAAAVVPGRIDLSLGVTGWDGPSPAFDLAMDAEMPLLEPFRSLAGAGWVSTGTVKAELSGRWDWSPDAAAPVAGRLAVEADLAAADSEERLTVAFAGDLQADADKLRLESTDQARLSWQPAGATGAMMLTLGTHSGDAFEMTLGAAADSWALTAAGPFRMADGRADLSGVVDVNASGSGFGAGPAGRIAAEISSPQAVLRLADEALALDGVSLSLQAFADDDPALRVSLDSATVRSLGVPARIVPLQVTGDARLGADDVLMFGVGIRGAAGALSARAAGRHDIASGVGSVGIRLYPLSFAPGVRQPADIVPALAAGLGSDVAGTLSGAARIDWPDTLSSDGQLRVEGLTLTHQGAAIRDMNGVLNADSLFPLNLPDGQLLSIGSADLGLALGEGAAAFGIAGDRLSVQGIGFSLAGGSLAVEPFQIGPGDRDVRMVVTMRGVELGLLSAQFPVEGLTVTGRLDGELPVRLFDDTISIDNGVLETTEPGVIRYTATLPVGPPSDGGVGLLIGAVRNFEYQGLRATLNGRTGDDLEVAIQLTGANPDLYDGYPIALNINLSGDLEQVLRSGLKSMAIAQDAGSLLRGE